MTSPLDAARRSINALTPDELRLLRDDVAALLDAYDNGGALTGRGWLEVKTIKKRYPVLQQNGTIEVETYYYQYAYVRRAQITENGRLTTATVGYYGKGGVTAIEAGLGEQLLAAHIQGGESAGDDFLLEHGYETPQRRNPQNNPPASEPVHPLGNPALTITELDKSPIFQFLKSVAPVDAARLYADVRQYAADVQMYDRANMEGLRYRLDNDELRGRRFRASRKRQPPRPVTLQRKRRKG